MTDAELSALEQAAKAATKHGNCPSNAFQNAMIDCLTIDPATILELIAELRQARAERDWLVQTLEDEQYCYPGPRMEGGILICEEQDIGCEECDRYSKEHWLKAAKEATQND